ncbi:MAG: acyltransferase [Alphaproteobacteria bacterium]|nr:acyltransferase [Alphaproteobacteria bacterium]
MVSQQSIRTFPALEGYRGIAALLIALYHYRCGFTGFGNYPAGDGYLAVDLFFVLSGFVLAHAYLPRLRRGLSVIDFMKIRLVRLYPLYFLGLVTGTAMLALGLGAVQGFSSGNLATSFAWEVFMLPSPTTFLNQLFPINFVGWSLFFEMAVNLLFALFWRFLNARVLAAVLLISGAGLCAYTLLIHSASSGNMWGPLMIFGVPRVIFSFFLGVFLYRLHEEGRLRIESGAAPVLMGAVMLAAYLLVPVDDVIRGIYDLGFILMLSPMLVILGINAPMSKEWRRVFSFIGAPSYALYVFHITFVTVAVSAARRLWDAPPIVAVALAAVAVMLGASVVADIVYDGPVRRMLTARFIKKAA